MTNTRNYGRRRRKGPRNLFSLNESPAAYAHQPRPSAQQRQWDRYVADLMPKPRLVPPRCTVCNVLVKPLAIVITDGELEPGILRKRWFCTRAHYSRWIDRARNAPGG